MHTSKNALCRESFYLIWTFILCIFHEEECVTYGPIITSFGKQNRCPVCKISLKTSYNYVHIQIYAVIIQHANLLLGVQALKLM